MTPAYYWKGQTKDIFTILSSSKDIYIYFENS